MAMARHTLADDAAVEDIKRREQCRRTVADVIVGHRPGPALLHRQAGLGAVKGLDLRLLVNRQHQTVGRRVEIEPDHVAQLGGKSRVLRQLEVVHPMRLQPVRRPDPRPPDMLLRAVAIHDHRRQLLEVGGTHLDIDPLAHRVLSPASPQYGIP